ncbi:hypothetical protein, partial [Streptomyces sp. 09ZI22]|uniref:hypothetical protein n=1 Tax=Streptomyces sp. 09ZI22 TaxID=2856603 RepID=UPI001C58D859
MRENRPTDHDRHNRIMPPTSKNTSRAITHQLVSTPDCWVRVRGWAAGTLSGGRAERGKRPFSLGDLGELC